MKRSLIGAAAIAAVMALTSAEAIAQTVTLKFGGFGSAQNPFYTEGIIPFIDRVEELSEGTVKIELFLNTLGTATELYENTLNGVADISWVIASAQRGFNFPRSEVLSLPLIANGYTVEQESVALWNLYDSGVVAGDFDEVMPIGFASMSQVHLISKGEEITLENIRGKNIAVTGGEIARAVGAIGGIPVFTPFPELSQAMARGTVDAVAVGFTGVLPTRLMEVSDTHTVVPLGSPLVFIGMNQAKFDSLPEKGQQAILQASGEVLSRSLGAAGDSFIGITKGALGGNPTQTIIQLSAADLAPWQGALQPLIDGWVAQTPDGAAVLDAYVAELERVKTGG